MRCDESLDRRTTCTEDEARSQRKVGLSLLQDVFRGEDFFRQAAKHKRPLSGEAKTLGSTENA